MRIALIVPFAKGSSPTGRDEHYKSFLTKPEEITVFWTGTIVPGETASDVLGDLAHTAEVIKKAEKDGFDAVVFVPHPDPAIEEVREIVSIPVVGPMQVALHLGAILGRRICVITPHEPLRRWVQYRVRAYAMEHMVSVRAMGMSVQETKPYFVEYQKTGKYGAVLDRFVETAIKGIEEDDATVITHGCGALIWLVDAARERLKEKGYDVTVINPLPAAVELARALVTLKLTHSRLAYPGFKWKESALYKPTRA